MTATNAIDSGNLAALVKKLYPQRRMEHLYKRGFPFLAEVKKMDDLEGSGVVVPVIHDHASVGNSFVAAQTYRYPSTNSAFTITGITQYGVGQVDALTMMKMRNNSGGFVRAIDNEVMSVLEGMKKHTALQLFREASGYIGVVSSISTNTITLTNKSDVWNFHIGQFLVAADASTGGNPRTGGDYTVTAMAPDAGTITVTSGTSCVAGDYLFNYSDESTGSTDSTGSITGMRQWIPAAAATDTLFGVARTGKPRLYGHRVTEVALSTEDAIQEAAYKIANACTTGGASWRCYMNPLQFRLLTYELGSKVVRDPGGLGVAGFDAIAIHTAIGKIMCVSDPACPEDGMWLVDLDSWELHHLGELFHIANEDSLRMLRVSDADRYEFRYRSFRQLCCTAPVRNAYIARNTAI